MTTTNALRLTSNAMVRTASTVSAPAGPRPVPPVAAGPVQPGRPAAGTEAVSARTTATDVRGALAAALSGHPPGSVVTFLVDPENMCLLGTGDQKFVDEQAFAELCEALVEVAGPDVRIVYGYSHHWVSRFRFELPEGRHLWRSGEDGGESVVIEAVMHEGLPLGTGSLVVLSGDGKFTDLVSSVAATGVLTTVVARTGALSRQLELAANRSVTFGERPGVGAVQSVEGGGHVDAA
jgi:hypothetical protein